MKEKNFDLIDVLKIGVKWRKPIIALVLLASISSVIVSLLLPNYYESNAIFFPSNPALTDRQNLFRTEAGDLPISFFGKEKDADRLLQIGKSSQLAAFIIQEFNLMQHYNIDPESTKYPQYAVNKEFSDNFQIFRNEFGAIEIHVLDQDKNLAAEMANTILDKIDEINNSMVRSNKEDIVKIFEDKKGAHELAINKTDSTLLLLKSKNKIYSLDAANKRLSNSSLSSNEVKELQKIVQLESQKTASLEALSIVNNLYDQYKTSAGENFSSVYILERAYPAEKKVKPIRWLIVVSTVLITFFVSLLTAVVIESAKSIKLS